jgi:hypothetical protein
LTTKDTKSTKFMSKNIWTLRGLRDLRGENVCAGSMTNNGQETYVSGENFQS